MRAVIPVFLLLGLAALAIDAQTLAQPANQQPMYGNIAKTGAMKEADEAFIAFILQKGYTRELGSKRTVKSGWNSFSKGDYTTAIMRFNQAWLLDPENGDAYHGFALITAVRGGAPGDIEKFFHMAFNKPKVSVAAHVDFGRFLWTRGRFNESLDRLHMALELVPNAYNARANISFVHFRLEEFEKACEWGKRAESNGEQLEPGYLDDMCSR